MLRHLYFAYGSNLYPAQMRARCPGHEVVSTARLRGWQLYFTAHSERWGGAVATIAPATPDAEVHGVVYRLSDTHIETLDGFEEHPYVYRQTPIEVHLDALGAPATVMTYIRPLEATLPGAPVYVHTIAQGYAAHALPLETLFAAARFRPEGW